MDKFGHFVYLAFQFSIFGVDTNDYLFISCIEEKLLSVMSVSRFYFVMISEFYFDSMSLLVI